MLESIINSLKKAALPSAIAVCSLVPQKALANYLYLSNVNEQEYSVEIDDYKAQVQIDTDNTILAEKLKYNALIAQKSGELKRDIGNLDYALVKLFWEPLKEAKTLANKINKLEKLIGIKNAKVPWWPLMLENPKQFNAKMIAVEDAWKYRSSAKKILELSKREQDPKLIYEKLCYMDDSIQQVTVYINALTNSSKYSADLVKLDEFDFLFEGVWKTFNLSKMEKTIDNIEERYQLKNEEVDKLKADLKEMQETNEDYRNFRDNIEKRDITKILKNYTTILSTAEKIFEKEYFIPLFTQENIKFQTLGSREYAKLKVKIEKTNKKGNKYNLRVLFRTDSALNKTQTNISLIVPEDILIKGKIIQKTIVLKNQKEEYKDAVSLSENKSVLFELEAAETAIDETISRTMKGNIVKTNNILNYLSDKIYDISLKSDQKGLMMLSRAFSESYNEPYSIKGIKINPLNSGQETIGYIWLIPVKENNQKPFFIYSHAGINSLFDKNAFNRQKFIMPINETEIKYRFDSKTCEDFFNDSFQKIIGQNTEDLESITRDKLKKDVLKLSFEEKLLLKPDNLQFSKFIELNPSAYLESAFFFEADYLYDTKEFINGYYPPACNYPDCKYPILSKTKNLLFGSPEEINKMESKYLKEELEVKFKGEGKFEIKSKTYPQLKRDVDIYKD